jgi:hypothetical protein
MLTYTTTFIGTCASFYFLWSINETQLSKGCFLKKIIYFLKRMQRTLGEPFEGTYGDRRKTKGYA